ncbi:hypothetical protein PIB30_053901, partial [Stylosanthes scabra]|nr:hypothetical protein [Stylosanthes scabra]
CNGKYLGNPEGFRVKEMRKRTYQFLFKKEADLERVLKGGHWLFRNAWLLVKRWERNEDLQEEGLDTTEIKLQIWGLPEHCKTTKLGQKIALSIGEVIDCAIYESNKDQERFLKATVKMNTNTPFKKGINVGSKEDGLCWVDFRYEHPLTFATTAASQDTRIVRLRGKKRQGRREGEFKEARSMA